MASAKRMARRAERMTLFHETEGKHALSHDKRTWASHNGGKRLTKAEVNLLMRWKGSDLDRAKKNEQYQQEQIRKEKEAALMLCKCGHPKDTHRLQADGRQPCKAPHCSCQKYALASA